jgi:hypothetical protein
MLTEALPMILFGLVTGLMAALMGSLPVMVVEDKIDVKELEKCLDRALKAYNGADHEKFWAEYCSAAKDLKTKQNFDDFRASIYMNYGKFVKRGELVKDKSNLEGELGLVLYKAEFEKDKKVVISVTWVKEGKAIKLAQPKVGQPQE